MKKIWKCKYEKQEEECMYVRQVEKQYFQFCRIVMESLKDKVLFPVLITLSNSFSQGLYNKMLGDATTEKPWYDVYFLVRNHQEKNIFMRHQ